MREVQSPPPTGVTTDNIGARLARKGESIMVVSGG